MSFSTKLPDRFRLQRRFARSSPATYSATVAEGSATAVDTPSAITTIAAEVGEGKRNLAVYTEAFDNTLWTTLSFHATVSANATTDPFGGSNADKLVPDTTTAQHYLAQAANDFIEPSQRYYSSVYAKAAGYTQISIANTRKSGGSSAVYFDLSTGRVSQPLGTSTQVGTMVDVGNGWWRCSTYSDMGTGASSFAGQVQINVVNNAASFAGDGTSGVYLYGAQREIFNFGQYDPVLTTQPDQSTVTAGLGYSVSVAEGGATALDTTNGITPRVGRVAWVRFFAPAAAGVTSASVAEGSATAADTPSATFVATASDIEGSATSVATQSSSAVFAATDAEGSATAVDTPSAANVTAATVAEGSATATDAPSAKFTAVVSVAEGTATATDTPSAATTIAASVVEGTATANDTPSADSNTVFSVSVAEGSSTAADTPSASYSTAAAVAESSVSADTPSAGTSTAASVVDGSPTAVDSPSAAYITAALCSEGGATALATSVAGTSTGAAVAEVANTLFDTPSANSALPVGVLEGSPTAADTPSTSATFVASLTEGANTALDTPNGSIVSASLGDVQEGSATSHDICTALVLFAGSVAEGTASAQDTASARAIWAAFIAEVGNGQAIQDWAGSTNAVVAEGSITASDTQNANRQANAFITEGGATAIDQQLVVVVFRGSIAEGTASAQDIASAGGVWNVAVAEVSQLVDRVFGDVPSRGVARTPVYEEHATAYVFTGAQLRVAVYTPVEEPQFLFTKPPAPEPMYIAV